MKLFRHDLYHDIIYHTMPVLADTILPTAQDAPKIIHLSFSFSLFLKTASPEPLILWGHSFIFIKCY